MNLGLEALTSASAADRDLHRPEFFRLAFPGDRERLLELLKRTPAMQVYDELFSQLRELVRVLNPSIKYSSAELDAAAKAHPGASEGANYGVWVHYPWSRRLVHLLDEVEFARVRTDRNRNKITSEEQALLATKKVGVIGLSVGQSVSLALTQERSFGELRLADYDTLDLSNLNRIRSGVHQLGLKKVVNVAREISEIDPFLKVTCFPEGITTDNIERFLTEGGKLDLLIEECDSVAIKIVSRQKAKALRIPVVMDTSDRGLIDVERFDLEPERPIMHGLVEHLDLSKAAEARTNEEKLPFVVPIIGLDTMSKRMKASMLEIESTVTTWPQLASSVALGGALVADVHRRIALGTFTQSGRWFVDPEELVAAPGKNMPVEVIRTTTKALTLEDMVSMAARVSPAGTGAGGFTADAARDLVAAGISAPSAGNLQPWRFLLHEGRILLFHDGQSGDSALDSGRLIPAVDMGTCLENVRLKAGELGMGVNIVPYPLTGEHRLVAVIQHDQNAVGKAEDLCTQIGQRCTNRRKGDGRALDPALQDELASAAAGVTGCQAHFIADRTALMHMARTIAEAERVRVLNPTGHHELFNKEIRWTEEEAKASRDGLDMATMELKLSEEVGFQVASDRMAMDLVAAWNGGGAFSKLSVDGMRAASGLVLVSATTSDAATLLAAGRAVQRVWLAAAKLGLAVHPVSAPILLAHHVRHGDGIGFSTVERERVLQLFGEVQQGFSTGSREPVFMMRLSHADGPSVRSLRKPLEKFFHVLEPTTIPAWNA
jgi:nitroreductase